MIQLKNCSKTLVNDETYSYIIGLSYFMIKNGNLKAMGFSFETIFVNTNVFQ